MIIEEIEELWEQRPFVPFEIAMVDGSVHVIGSPKWMLLSRNGGFLVYVKQEGPSHRLATHLITRVSEVATVGQAAAA